MSGGESGLSKIEKLNNFGLKWPVIWCRLDGPKTEIGRSAEIEFQNISSCKLNPMTSKVTWPEQFASHGTLRIKYEGSYVISFISYVIFLHFFISFRWFFEFDGSLWCLYTISVAPKQFSRIVKDVSKVVSNVWHRWTRFFYYKSSLILPQTHRLYCDVTYATQFTPLPQW